MSPFPQPAVSAISYCPDVGPLKRPSACDAEKHQKVDCYLIDRTRRLGNEQTSEVYRRGGGSLSAGRGTKRHGRGGRGSRVQAEVDDVPGSPWLSHFVFDWRRMWVDPRCLTVHLGCRTFAQAERRDEHIYRPPPRPPCYGGPAGEESKAAPRAPRWRKWGSAVWGCWWRRKLKDDVDTPFARGSRCRIGTFARNGPRLCAMGWHSRSATRVIVCVGGRLNLYRVV